MEAPPTRVHDSVPMLEAIALAARIGVVKSGPAETVATFLREGRLLPLVDPVAEALSLDPALLRAIVRIAGALPADSTADALHDLVGALRRTPHDPFAGHTTEATVVHGEPVATPERSPTVLPETVARAAAQPENCIGRYVLVSVIGAGGMGTVWAAWDESLARLVAVKMLRHDAASAPNLRERFLREARAVARLRHPGIVSIHEVGEDRGSPFLAMDYIQGATMAARFDAVAPLKQAGLPAGWKDLRADVELLARIAEAIGFAHENGIVHRDLKPGNVLLDREGRPFVSDFGLAKDLTADGAGALTRDGALLGTPGYMSPEQAEGSPGVGPATDVYSLGVILYEILTGRLPFSCVTLGELLKSLHHDDPPMPHTLWARVPRDLETIALKCLERDPGRRYPEAAALAAELRRWLDGEPILARPVPLLRRAGRWTKRHRALVIVLTFLCATAVTAGAVRSREQQRYEQRARLRASAAADTEEAAGAWRAGDLARVRTIALRVERSTAELLQHEPDAGDLHLLRGRLRQLDADDAGARWDFDRAIALLGDRDAAPWAERGRLRILLYRRGLERTRARIEDPDRAAEADAAALEAIDPELRDLRMQAAADLSEASRRGLSGPEQQRTEAHLAALARDWDRTLRAADAALRLDVSAEGYWLRGLALAGRSEWDGALEAMGNAIALGQGFAEAWLGRAKARCMILEGRRHPLITEILDGVADPARVDEIDALGRAVLADLARAAELGADPRQRAAVLGEVAWHVAETHRKTARRQREKGRVVDIRGRISAWLTELEAVEPHAKDAAVWYRLGQLWECYALAVSDLFAPEEMRQAIECYSQAIEMAPRFAGSYRFRAFAEYELACSLTESGENPRRWFHLAIADFERFFRVEPDEEQRTDARLYRALAIHNLADWARVRGGTVWDDYRAALAGVESLEMNYGDLYVMRSHIRILLGLHDLEEGRDSSESMRHALAEIQRTEEIDPDWKTEQMTGWARYGIARGLQRAGLDASKEFRLAADQLRAGAQGTLWGLLWTLEALVRAGDLDAALAELTRVDDHPNASPYRIADGLLLPALERLADELDRDPPDPSRAGSALGLARAAARVGAQFEPKRMHEVALRAALAARRLGVSDPVFEENAELAAVLADPRWQR